MRIMKLLSRRVLAVLLTLVMCLGMLPGTALAAEAAADAAPPVTEGELSADTMGFAGGSGTESDPYLISSAGGLRYLAQVVNSEDTAKYHDKYFALTADIDLGGAEWTPIGIDVNHAFWGTFYGGGHTISNFTCDRDVAGLFGWVAYAKIYNLTISDAAVTASGPHCAAGALVAVDYCDGNWSYSTDLDNCHVVDSTVQTNGTYSNVAYRPCAGGLVGTASRKLNIRYCTVVNSDISSSHIAGGVLGSASINRCTININNTACINSTVSSTGTRLEGRAGGILGSAADWVRGNNDSNSVIGCFGLVLDNCLNTASVTTVTTGTSSYSGGMIGYFSRGQGTYLRSCLNTGTVSKGNHVMLGYASPSIATTTCYTDIDTAKIKLSSNNWDLDGDTPVPKGCPGCDDCNVTIQSPSRPDDEPVTVTFRVKNGQWEASSLKERTQEYTSAVTAAGKLTGSIPATMTSAAPGKWYGLRGGAVAEFTRDEILEGTYTEPTVFIYAYPQQTHTVTFDLRDGSPLVYLAVPEGEVIPTDMFPDTESHAGSYTFSGWEYPDYQYGDQFTVRIEGYENIIFTQNPRYADWRESTTVTDDIVLYAKWDGYNVYYAQFETSGGPDIPSQRFTDPDTVIRPQIRGWTISDWCYSLYTSYYYDVIPVLHEWNFGHTNQNDHSWARLLALSTAYDTIDENNVIRLYGYDISKVDPPADTPDSIDGLTVTKTAQQQAPQGSQFDYTLTVGNTSSVAKTVTVTDVLPEGTTFVSCDPAVDGSLVAYNETSKTVTWTPTVQPNNSAVLKIKVEVDDAAAVDTEIENKATLTSGDNTTLDSATVTTTVTAKPEVPYAVIWQAVDNDELPTTGNLPWIPLARRDNVTASSEPTWATVKADDNCRDPQPYTLAGTTYTWTGAWEEPIWSADNTVKTYKAKYEAESGSGGGDDPNYSIAVNKTITPPTDGITADSVVTYTVTVENNGTDSLYDLEITDTMDAVYEAGGSMSAGLTLKSVTSQTVAQNGEDSAEIQFIAPGETNLGAPLRNEDGTQQRDENSSILRDEDSAKRVNVYTWRLPGEFKPGAQVSLIYKATVTNETSEAVELHNIADATAYTTPGEAENDPEQQGIERLSLRTAPIARGRVSVSGTSGASTGSVSGSTTTGPVQPKKFTVTYKNSAEASAAIRAVPVTNGTMHTILAGTIATPPDENSMFEVWLGDDGQRYQPGSEVKITQNLTLTAIWKNKPADAVNYTLTFDPNQGTAGATEELTARSTEAERIFTIPRSAEPSRENYVFTGWADHENAAEAVYFVGSQVTLGKDSPTKTLYAVWEEPTVLPAKHTYTLTCNDGTEELDRQTFTTTALSHAFIIPTASRPGWELSGWSETDSGAVRYRAGEQITLTSDDPNETLYAVWKELETDPDAPSDDEILALGIQVKVVCRTNATHSEEITEQYPLEEGTFAAQMSRDGKSCTLRIIPDAYIAQFNEDHGLHTYDDVNVQGFVELIYEEDEVIETPDQEDPDVPAGAPSDEDPAPSDEDPAPSDEDPAPSDEDPAPSDEDPAPSDEDPAPSGEDMEASGEPAAPVQFSALSLADDPAGSWRLADGEPGTVTFSVHCEEPEEPDVPDVPETLEVTVIWLDGEDGNTLKTAKVEVPADDPTSIPGRLYPRNPIRDGYRFTGWGAPVERDGVVTIVAQWERLPEEERTLTVTWLDWDGALLAREDWDPDDPEPRYPGRTPVRPDSSRYTYTFSGWDRQVDGEGNVTYTAVYTRDRIYDDDDGDNNYGGGGNGGGALTPPATAIPDPDVPQGGDTTTILDERTPLAGAIGLNNTEHFAYMIGYENGTVRPLGQITRAEVATIFFRLMDDSFRSQYWSTASGFSDVAAGKWFNNAVSTGVNAGKLTGYPDGTFRPNQSITRAEFAAIAVRFLSDEVQGVSGGSFSDTAGHWAADAIGRAAAAGWITGYPDGTFRPNQSITRAEAATIINNMLGRAPDKDHLLAGMTTWPDNPEGAWYYEAIQEATNSHDYDRDELGVTEIWRAIQTVRDWKALEEQWAA